MKLIKHTAKLPVGGKTQFELPAMGGAGYQWQLSSGFQDIVEVDIVSGMTDEEAKKKPPGASGTAQVKLNALKKGKTTISLLHKRSWEGDETAAEKCEIDVDVS